MKKLIVFVLFLLLTCFSCTTNYGNAVNNTTNDSLQRIEIYGKNAGNLNSINVSTIQKQVIIEDTTELNNQEFKKYCDKNIISNNINDWQQLNIGEYESGKLITTYTTFVGDTVYRLQTLSNNNITTYKIIKRIKKNI